MRKGGVNGAFQYSVPVGPAHSPQPCSIQSINLNCSLTDPLQGRAPRTTGLQRASGNKCRCSTLGEDLATQRTGWARDRFLLRVSSRCCCPSADASIMNDKSSAPGNFVPALAGASETAGPTDKHRSSHTNVTKLSLP